jgi:alpha-amylase/alpha-mannosidase (GH57 family)
MKYIIIHSHFYQPPRENPCLSAILRQNEVKPYHDWNERITDECYRPNYASRVLDDRGRILDIVNNYEYMSFNVGPTLLGYLKEKASDVYEKIIYADKESCKRLGGYGNAIAQVYNHIILPLASYRDKLTEIKWGIEDFYYHFGRLPDGMWLSETAINSETIDALYISGIRFTILSPYQAKAVFSKAENKWIDVSDGSIDYSKPYVVFGRRGHIFVFFYNPYISGEISFGSLLQNGDVLFGRMMEAIENKEMVNVAVDGETFGHHKPFGDMCLAYFFRRLFREREDVQPVNYSYYLNIYPADEIEEVRLKEGKGGRGTSWSCIHGVERWRDDCGCQTGGKPEWQQKWRFFMRKAIDELKSGIDYLYQKNINHKYIHS